VEVFLPASTRGTFFNIQYLVSLGCIVAMIWLNKQHETVEMVLLRICVAVEMLSRSRCMNTCRLVPLRDRPNREHSLFLLLRWSVTDVCNMWEVPMEGSHTFFEAVTSVSVGFLLCFGSRENS
jgi:hypothetical protein